MSTETIGTFAMTTATGYGLNGMGVVNVDKVPMVMLVSKKLEVNEWTTVICSLFYASGKWNIHVSRRMMRDAWHDYKDGHVSQSLEDFALDYLAGRLPPNLLVNGIEKARMITKEENDQREKTRKIDKR